MTWMRFNVGPEGGELRDPDLPIEVRDATMTLVYEATARDSIKLEPGNYLITARLPGGQTLNKLIDLKGEQAVCDLIPATPIPLPSSLESWQFIEDMHPNRWRRPTARSGATGPAPGTRPPARLRMFRGNALDGTVQETTESLKFVKRANGVVRLSLMPSDTPRFLQVLHIGQPPVVIAVPTSVNAGCTVVIYRQATRYWVELYPQNYEAGVLFRYRQNNLAQQQAAVAETLLRRKMDDAIAAAVGGYTLLRFGDLTLLHDWTENLCGRFPTLPDGALIYGEHLARLGKHAEAVKTFARIPARGLPIFSDGIRLLFERMKLYADSEFAASAKDLVNRFSPYIRAVDFDHALTTFAGTNPADPDDTRRIPVTQLPFTGIEIGPWFG
jgi:hypothetical protein